jgi:pimeloyl-ACP methyl ester carboxylesterase
MVSATKSIRTKVLEIGYLESGPADGTPLVLVHGWPDDVLTWRAVAPALADAGFRVLMPYLRGFGPTRFLEETDVRSGELAALGQDVLDFADALKLDAFALVGSDWGARAAYIAASEQPKRIRALVALSVGYGTNHPDQELSLTQIRNYWYHWYFALARGYQLLTDRRRELTLDMWRHWCPNWVIDPAEFEATAASFDNPDWVEVTTHSYRHRWGYADGEGRYAPLEHKIYTVPPLSVPTLVLHGGADRCNDPSTSDNKDHLFSGPYQRTLLPSAGHFPQREAPAEVAREILGWLAQHAPARA